MNNDEKHPIVRQLERAAGEAISIAQAEANRQAPPMPDHFDNEQDTARNQRGRRRDALAQFANQCGVWRTPDGAAFVSIPVADHFENWRVESVQFARWLAGKAYRETGQAPTGQAIADIVRTVAARCFEEGEIRKSWLRVGRTDDAVFIDLGDREWRAIKVTAKGWEILDGHKLPFWRSDTIAPLPEPVAGESIDRLRRFLNVSGEAEFILTVAWMLAALGNVSPFPILALGGETGTGKTTFTETIRSFVDPSPAEHTGLEGLAARDFAVEATNTYVMAFDNVSHISAEISDMLCRASTGSAYAARTLHTDTQRTVMHLRNPIVFNGIPEFVERADLVNRMIGIRLRLMSDTERETEGELAKQLAEAAPAIMGALLDGISAGLRNFESTKLDRYPRLADFARWATACESGIGWEPGTFMRVYSENRSYASEVAFESNPFAVAVFELAMENRERGWHGSATELYESLRLRVSEQVQRSRQWPGSAQSLGNWRERVAPVLRERGVHMDRIRSNGTKYSITVSDKGKGGG
jgi:putative DNA primase/helicase